MKGKQIQTERVMRYFIDAAAEIIEKEGIEQVTIRKVADIAGYTSSTAYNYFKEFTHLLFFASMKFTKDYIKELPLFLEKGENTIEKWLQSWICFCQHSFESPQIFSMIFLSDLGENSDKLLEQYFSLYEKEWSFLSDEMKPFVLEHSFQKRSTNYLRQAVEEGFLHIDDVEPLADMTFLIWKGMLSSIINNRRYDSDKEALHKTILYVKKITIATVVQDKKNLIKFDI
jgi:AcrR family transcriptional regulator